MNDIDAAHPSFDACDYACAASASRWCAGLDVLSSRNHTDSCEDLAAKRSAADGRTRKLTNLVTGRDSVAHN